MDSQDFMEALNNLKIFAQSNGNLVSKKDVYDCFGDEIELDDNKWQMIAGYLKMNDIAMADVDLQENKFEKMMLEDAKEDTASAEDASLEDVKKNNEEEDKLLAMYLEDLKEIVPLTKNTEAYILQDICDKDEESRAVLINNYFVKAVDWAKEISKKSQMSIMDIIEEANLVIVDELNKRDWMKKLDAFDVMDSIKVEDWIDLSDRLDEYLKEKIHAVIDKLENGISEEKLAGKIVLNKVNKVNDAAAEAFKEYGRKVSVAELADFMKVSKEEIVEALKLSGDKIENIVVPK